MKKSEVIQTRVNKSTKERLEERAQENEQSLSELLRDIINGYTDSDEDVRNIKHDFLADIVSLSSRYGTQPGVSKIIKESWEETVNSESARRAKELIFESEGLVFIAGQGSSATIAQWLAARLRAQDVMAVGGSAEDVPCANLRANDVLVLISKSGETNSVCRSADHSPTDTKTIGVTTPGSSAAAASDVVIPIPAVSENVEAYATRSVIVMMMILQASILSSQPELEMFNNLIIPVEKFIENHITTNISKHESFEIGDETISINPQSPFEEVTQKLNKNNDISADPVVASIGTYHPLGRELVQKQMEFLHVHGSHDDLGSVRDGLLNVLYQGDAYLFTILPDQAEKEYSACLNYLFENDTSVRNLLKLVPDPADLRLIALSFNSGDGIIERETKRESAYGEVSHISFEDHSPAVNDIIVLISTYFFTFSLLVKRWEQDRKLRREINRGPEL